MFLYCRDSCLIILVCLEMMSKRRRDREKEREREKTNLFLCAPTTVFERGEYKKKKKKDKNSKSNVLLFSVLRNIRPVAFQRGHYYRNVYLRRPNESRLKTHRPRLPGGPGGKEGWSSAAVTNNQIPMTGAAAPSFSIIVIFQNISVARRRDTDRRRSARKNVSAGPRSKSKRGHSALPPIPSLSSYALFCFFQAHIRFTTFYYIKC